MRKEDTYYVFNNLDECKAVIKEINKRKNLKGEMTWCEPQENQIDESWLVIYQEDEIKNCLDLLEDFEEIDKLEAEKRGWYFGLHKGSFAREREKLEDLHFIFDALVQNIDSPNFPVTRALMLSFLSACYSLRESIYNKNKKPKLNSLLGQWNNEKKREQEKKGELIHSFLKYMNTEKHGGHALGQFSLIKVAPQLQCRGASHQSIPENLKPYKTTLSSEGQLITAKINTPFERRFPIGFIHGAKYKIKVLNAPKVHLGKSIKNATFLEMMTLIKNYYMQLIFDAEIKLGEKKTNFTSKIYFHNTQFDEK